MLQNFKYYLNSFPDNRYDNVYALYQPAADCFLICTTNLNAALNVKVLLSSRYTLHVVKLNSANNYQPRMINNICCQNWTFSNRGELHINFMVTQKQWIPAEMLCNTVPKILVDWDREKEYAMLCFHWFNKLDHCESDVQRFIDLTNFDSAFCNRDDYILKSQIYDTLYRGRDVATVEETITNLILEHEKNNLFRSKSIITHGLLDN